MIGLSVYRAAWVVPVAGPPMADAWVAARGGRIVEVGQGAPTGAVREVDLGPVALMPGVVNAHTHLELSGLRDLVPASPSLVEWVRALVNLRATRPDDPAAAASAIDEAVAAGTVACADISNTLSVLEPLARRPLDAVVFHEVLGFDPSRAADSYASACLRMREAGAPPGVQLRLAPHAPYSTSAELIRLLVGGPQPWPPTSIHLAESREEVEFLATGRGAWRDLLAQLGVLPGGWQAPATTPVEYLDGLGVWKPGALAVHGVHLTAAELERLAARDVTLVTCPRSNVHVGAGVPPVGRFAASGVRVAIGTDSLASAPDLNLFAELAALRQLAPDVPARTLLSWATQNGAVALGLESDYGSLAPGRRARFLAVRVPESTDAVEEALVSGVVPSDVTWIDDRVPVAA